jgi:hypothetical protein
MPYIKPESRSLANFLPKTAGELNYSFTKTALHYIAKRGLCYQTINDIIGALEGCKLEMYRRLVAPYEDKKIEENGDVY